MQQVQVVLDGVLGMTAPPQDLLAAAQRGLEKIDEIASSAPAVDEEMELLEYAEPLEQLVEELHELIGEAS
jgi:hypothetical protein